MQRAGRFLQRLRPLRLPVQALLPLIPFTSQPGHLLAQPAAFRPQRLDQLALVARSLGERIPASGAGTARPHDAERFAQPFAQPPVLIAQLRDLHSQRHRRAALARVHPRRGQQFRQPLHFLLQRHRIPGRAPDGLGLIARLDQLLSIGREYTLEGTELAAGGDLRPAPLLGLRLGRLGARHRPLMTQTPRLDLIRLRGLRIRERRVQPPDRRHSAANILRAHGHARNHSGIPIVLPDPKGGFFARSGQARFASAEQSR